MIPEVEWWDILIRLLVAAALTGAIGLERELRDAGPHDARSDDPDDREVDAGIRFGGRRRVGAQERGDVEAGAAHGAPVVHRVMHVGEHLAEPVLERCALLVGGDPIDLDVHPRLHLAADDADLEELASLVPDAVGELIRTTPSA